MRDYEILRTASAIEVVKCLTDIWEQTKGEGQDDQRNDSVAFFRVRNDNNIPARAYDRDEE